MKIYVQGLFASLLMAILFMACSRPTAYFQPTTREHFSSTAKPASATDLTNQSTASGVVPTETVAPTSIPVIQATQALDKVDVLVRNDQKLVADRTVQKRLSRVRTMLATAVGKGNLTPSTGAVSKKMNLMQHLMVKKLNRTINRQLAPANPEKAMAIKGVLALGAVVLLAGIIILLISSAGTTGATIGVIGIIGGLILLLIGLI
jgi:hypothetical protein